MIKGRLKDGILLDTANGAATQPPLRSHEIRRITGEICVKVTRTPSSKDQSDSQNTETGPLYFTVRFSLGTPENSADDHVKDVPNTLIRQLKFDLPKSE